MDCRWCPIYIKFALRVSHPFRKRRFWQISLNSAMCQICKKSSVASCEPTAGEISIFHVVIWALCSSFDSWTLPIVSILEDSHCCQVVSVHRRFVKCMVFEELQPLYTSPCDSRILGVFCARLSSGVLKHFSPDTKVRKAMSCIDFVRSEVLFIQLLHTV